MFSCIRKMSFYNTLRNTLLCIMGIFIATFSFNFMPIAYAESSSSMLHEMAIQEARKGNFNEALQLMNKSLKERNNAPETFYDHILMLSWANKCKEAIKLYTHIKLYTTLKLQQDIPGYVINEVARCYRITGDFPKAIQLYKQYLTKNDNDKEGVKGLILTYIQNNQRETARNYIKQYSAEHPDMDLFLKAELFETAGNYLDAYYIYENILKHQPSNKKARSLQYKAVMQLGAYSLLREKLNRTKDQIDPDMEYILRGNEAAALIHWNELDRAQYMLEQNILDLTKQKENKTLSPIMVSDFINRTQSDLIDVLNKKQEYNHVIKKYENLLQSQIIPNPWTKLYAAEAYSAGAKPDKSMQLHDEIADKLDKYDRPLAQMSIYQTLLKLDRYEDAERLLSSLIASMPNRAVVRGVLQDNWQKADAALNQGWWFLSQDRLQEANKYFSNMLERSSFNTNIRIALAYTYLWRGLPRKSLEELEIVRTMDPENVTGSIGYCYALADNNRAREASLTARSLLELNPKNMHVRNLYKDLKVREMRTLNFNTSYTDENPGANESNWSLIFNQPVAYKGKISAGYMERRTTYNSESQNLEDNIRRALFGVNWDLYRSLSIRGELSFNNDGDDAGISGQIDIFPSDYLSCNLFYNSYSLSTPIRSKASGLNASESGVTGMLRLNESCSAKADVRLLRISDNNNQLGYRISLEKSILTRAFWKTKLSLESSLETHSKTNVFYYSPELMQSVYITPMVEHVWHRRQEKTLTSRCFAGGGIQKEKGFDTQKVWNIRHELDCRFSKTFSLIIGSAYDLNNYDGEDTNVWNFYTTCTKRF
ncbi:MAG: hypothetical protein ABII27_03215 [bacterium]